MAIKRIITKKGKSNSDTVIFIRTTDNKTIRLNKGDLVRHNTPAALKSEAAKQLGRDASEFFFHINRDGSVAVSVGRDLAVWPEDAADE